MPMTDRPSKLRLVLFAFGDFAFNLYWQSIMLFLLFYYTDAVELPIAMAATTYMIASVWDGIANFAAGVLVDRRRGGVRYGPLIAAGAVPLGLTFVLNYMPPPVRGGCGGFPGPFSPPPVPPPPFRGEQPGPPP